ncbi:MAG: hypothetical protein QY312_01475 [Candidatus Dojkabacteria bacterium]|nr:MAG: hypothetical protein QY312_01475 [Candidatus Dojkabacteria bacterium]
MGFFSRKKNNRQPAKFRSSVYMRGIRATSVGASARQRNRQLAKLRIKKAFKVMVVSLVLAVGLLATVGVLGVVSYSLKNRNATGLTEIITGYLRETPLGFLFQADDTKDEKKLVLGLGEVPVYPGSDFVFEEYIERVGEKGFMLRNNVLNATDAQALYDFLTSGQSVYRLPVTAEWHQVVEYYREELPKNGWTHVLSVSLSETNRVFGEYYTKDEIGLHVYTVASDVWYETITATQAENGLQDKVVAYKAKQELVAAASGRDLPPEAVWKLRYSRDWEVEVTKHPTFGVNTITFTQTATKERVTLAPVKQYQGELVADISYQELRKIGEEYIAHWLTTQPTTVSLQGFTRKEIVIADGKGFEFMDAKNNAYFLVCVHKTNRFVYLVQYFGKENLEFIQYIKENLKQ